MGDCGPSTSGRDELSEKEKHALSGLWVFVQPMNLYKHLQQRQQSNASFLRRNLTYHRPQHSSSDLRNTKLFLQLSFEEEHQASPLFVIMCKKVLGIGRKSAMSFEPLSVQLITFDASASCHGSSRITVKVPHEHQHQSAQLGVITLTSGNPSIRHLLETCKKKIKRHKSGSCLSKQAPSTASTRVFSLSQECSLDKAFGLLPSHDTVCWQFTDLPATWGKKPTLPAKVSLRKGVLTTVPSRSGVLLQITSQVKEGPSLSMQMDLAAATTPLRDTRESSLGSEGSSSRCAEANSVVQGSSNHHRNHAHSQSLPDSQEDTTVHFCYYFHDEQRHVREATTGFTCFACRQSCRGLLGLKQHIEASHDLFDFEYAPWASGQVPTIFVRCPSDLYNQQGQLQNPECDDIGFCKDGKVMCFELRSGKLRQLRLQQYTMTDADRCRHPKLLTQNQFSKAAWKLWHSRLCVSAQQADAVPFPQAVIASSPESASALPLRPFLANPQTLPTHDHYAEASTSNSANHMGFASNSANHVGFAGASASNSADASGAGSGVANVSKAAAAVQRQAESKKRKRTQSYASASRDAPEPVYYHARSCSRMVAEEVAQILQDPRAVPDSDDEEDHRDRMIRAVKQLDKQTDLSQAEKQLMLSWNLHLHEHPCLANSHMGQRCLDFAAANCQDLRASPDLKRCFMVHLINLWEFNLISPDLVHACVASIECLTVPTTAR